jgi:protein-L-isoaspartate(D-aspartate) O-methyltransferase
MRASAAAFALLCLAAPPCAAEPAPPVQQAAPDPYAGARAAMVAWLRPQLVAAGLRDDARLRAILRVIGRLPREDFVPAGQRASAYAPAPLPIGGGQTISDAFIMAYMTRMLELRPGDRVLEIGTGSGYQAAILGGLVERVHSIEIVPELAERAALTLRGHGFANVHVRQGDGYAGWPEAAPFDAIIVTAGAVRIPPALVAQLRPGGRMILPLGPNWAQQRMTLVRKRRDGSIDVSACGWVIFVPFVGAAQTGVPGPAPTSRRRLNARCDEPLGVRARQVPADDFARPDH